MKKTTLLLHSVLCLGLLGGPAYTAAAWSSPSATPPPQEAVAKPVALTFSPAVVGRDIQQIAVASTAVPLTPEKAMRLLPASKKLIKATPTSLGTVFLYSTRKDSETLYAAFISKDKNSLYSLGPSGSLASSNLEEVKVESLFKDHSPLLRIKGVCGANPQETHYFYRVDQKPVALLVAQGHVVTADLDNDGVPELIASSDIPQVTFVYKYAGGGFQEANLNQQLQAASVSFDPKTKNFEAVFAGQTAPLRYSYQTGGVLQPVR
ncbi:hypothetical protein [Tumebacillus flagellatus]|uniref:VCBS repeat-containing protein n=1 Tax=Tumebacillus flagellatus TaxID=1157490 RepID=A0A074LT42_9BACL|nr:hypothetical protein [Tumebacillus flagellatus]KEO84169.1 hypothetical protein EL26_05220 [Tumebacillus flagellatus]